MAATTFHSVIIVFWKETAFPRWRAMDRRWKRNSVSLVSSVTTVMRQPISCITSMSVSCHAPAVLMANVLCCSVSCCTCFDHCAADMRLGICVWYCYVPGHRLTSSPWQQRGPIWSFVVISDQAGIWAHFSARQMMSFSWLWRCCLGALLRQSHLPMSNYFISFIKMYLRISETYEKMLPKVLI